MRILILGQNYSAKNFLELFSKNKENIVFSQIKDTTSYISFENSEDIIEFCQANEINLVLIIDENYIDLGLNESLSNLGISVFSPSCEAVSICESKAVAKKFMYKNNIITPRFQIIEKPQLGINYFKEAQQPQVIKPDTRNYKEAPYCCETLKDAQKTINDFFNNGNKRIIMEDYIEGKNISVWILTDGYNAKIIGTSAKYQDDIAYFNPKFINENLKNTIMNEFIMPTINALSESDSEYIGILGFDFILTYDNELSLLGYNSFFDDINVDFYTKGFDIDWTGVFDSTIIGDVFIKYDFISETKFMLNYRSNGKISNIGAKTKANLDRYIEELEYDIKEIDEAKKIWKY